MIDTSKLGVLLGFLTIVTIIGHILILNWKIVGFFLNVVAFFIVFSFLMSAKGTYPAL
jgi:hypothetical protein